MALPLAEDYYAAQARQEEAAQLLARREWQTVDPGDIDRSWQRVGPRLTLVVGSGQLGAAKAGAAYVEQAVDVAPVAEVNPRAWAGVASDGRPLQSLMYSSVIHSKALIGAGMNPEEALATASGRLAMTVQTQIADASRGAAGAAIAARPEVGYVRLVSAPCCQRCAVLAGKMFKWNQGFLRHPRCHCRHVPAEGGGFPDGYSADINPDQIHDLTDAQRRAISDGADLNQVINAHRRGRRSRDGMTTSEGASRTGQRRLTPEGIYRTSATREEAIERLREHGYLIDRGSVSRPAQPSRPSAQPRQVVELSDDELESEMSRLMESGDFDSPRMEQLAYEMDKRDQLRQAADLAREEAEERAKWGNGWRRDGGSSERALRDEYETFVEVQYVTAEQELNGVLLSAEGRRAGIDPRDLFTRKRRSLKYASEELQEWFARNPRMSFPEFRAGALQDDVGRAARQRSQGRGWESEFG